MKRIYSIILVVLLSASGAFGDEVDTGLANMATEQVRVSARQMVDAGIKTDDVVKMTRLMTRNRFTERMVLEAHAIVMNAQREQLPVTPVLNKAYEGMAKGINSTAVVSAMETVRSRYSYAYARAKEVTDVQTRTNKLGDVIAQGLAAGIDKKDIDAVMGRLRVRTAVMNKNESYGLAVATFTAAREMARFGVSSKETATVVSQALRHDYSAEEMNRMRTSFMSRTGYSKPDSLAKSFSAQIGQGVSAGNLGASGSGGKGGSGSTGGTGESGGSGGDGGSGNGGDGGSGGSGSGGGAGGGSGSGGSSGGSGGGGT